MDSSSQVDQYDRFGLIKTNLDVHTLGIINAATFLKDCKIHVTIASKDIEVCVERLKEQDNQERLYAWITNNHLNHIGFSYRLDPSDGERIFIEFYRFLRDYLLLKEQGGPIRQVVFSGLPETCKRVEKACNGRVITFEGDETPEEFLSKIGVSLDLLPKYLKSNTPYDKKRLNLAEELYKSGIWENEEKPDHGGYPEFGTSKDTIIKRLDYIKKISGTPIIRAHLGPFDENRQAALTLFSEWIKDLASKGYLDVLSIGSSQLTQSHFEKNWSGLKNGGGAPIQNREEYYRILIDAKPMLVRAYAGTDRLEFMARIHEQYLNIAWHALSFWWFNKLDGRGPLSLEENLQQTFNAIKYIASTNKPLEANVSHQFAFRGSDDLTYVVSAYLTAKAARKYGIKNFILQNMLNTPNLTWGINDIAKARAMLSLVKSLENQEFKVIYETRAGLSYFSPNIEKAKRQLMAVTMLMDDIEPDNNLSPQIIHVVSYSEAQYLATPSVVDESIKLTLFSLKEYRKIKKTDNIFNDSEIEFIQNRTAKLINDAKILIAAMESRIDDLYSPKGFYQAFLCGYFPVPQLWAEREIFSKAVTWQVKYLDGGYHVVNNEGKPLSIEERIAHLLY